MSDDLNRRDALKLLAAGTAAAIPRRPAHGQPQRTFNPLAGTGQAPAGTPGAPGPRGTPTDPDLINPVVWWEKVLTEDELHTVAALCDQIIPADDRSPAASAVGAHDYINEHVSAPYEAQRRELVTLRGGLIWLDTESQRRFGKRFTALAMAEKTAICDDICHQASAKPEFRSAARFFSLVRNLTATAFYSTPEGMRDLGYRGNTPQASWNGPPPEVLRHIGLGDG